MTIHRLHSSGHSMPQSWQERLSAATSEVDVVSITRDFTAQFSPTEIAQLPEACRPGRIVDGNDVTEYAFTLVRHGCERGEGAAHLAQRLAAFFAAAATQLSKILHTQHRDIAAEDRRSA